METKIKKEKKKSQKEKKLLATALNSWDHLGLMIIYQQKEKQARSEKNQLCIY